MSVFLDIADQYRITDAALADRERSAFHADDDQAVDRAVKARRRNDQAYVLYLFTRYEAEVNAAIETLLAIRKSAATPWAERRVWQAWARTAVQDIALLSKVEVLTDKGRTDYAAAKTYYEGRNTIAHGEDWENPFFVPTVAQDMHDMVGRFIVT